MIESLSKLSISTLLLAIPLYLSIHCVGAAKWLIIVNAGGAELRWIDAIRCYYAGLFGNFFVPSVIGGDVVRAGVAYRLAKNKAALVLGSVVDRAVDSLGLAAVAAAGAILLPTALDAGARRVFIVLITLTVAALVGLLVAARLAPVSRLGFRHRRRLVRARRAFRQILARPSLIATSFVLVVLSQTSQVALNIWLADSIGVHAPVIVWLFVWPLAKIAATLPLTQGGLGVREAAQAILFAPFGVDAASAVAAGLVFQSVVILGGLVAGAISWALGRIEAADHSGVTSKGDP